LLSFRISFLHFSCLYLFSQEVYYAAQPLERLCVDAHKSIAAEGPGNQPTYIYGLADLQMLDQPVKKHDLAKEIGTKKTDIEKAVQKKIGQVSDQQPSTPSAKRKLIAADKETTFRQLVIAKEMAEFHQ